jgi:hypothetical protein
MPSPSPTPTPGIPELVAGFFWNHWLGQVLLGAAVLGLIGWIFRTWIKHRLQQLGEWLRDLRLTRRSVVDAEIASAVAGTEGEWEARVAEVRAEGGEALEQLREELTPSAPAIVTPEEAAEIRDHYRRQRSLEDQWVISTNRSRRHAYVLRNYAARETTNVTLRSPFHGAFEFFDPPEWDQMNEGDAVSFTGRIANPDSFEVSGRGLQVSWTDDHGDEQTRRVQIDRDDSLSRAWS